MSPIERAAAAVASATGVLVLRPQSVAYRDAACKRRLVSDPAAELLGVSFSQPPAAWYDDWCEVLETRPAAAAVITTSELGDDDVGDRDLDVETVATPSNLTGVGVKSTPYLNEWSDPTVAVESLTTLLQYTGPQTVYRFLHALTTRLQSAGARGQFYLDPNTVDAQTVELLKTLFDGVIEYEGSAGGEADGGSEWRGRLREP
ncbi:MAG: hypothetical protein ABEK02_04965 [Haloquadratum sp.]